MVSTAEGEKVVSSTVISVPVKRLPTSSRTVSKPTFPTSESDLAKALRVFQQAAVDLRREIANTSRRDLKVLAVDEPPDGAVLVLVGFAYCPVCHNFRVGKEAVNAGCSECVGNAGNAA